MDKAIKLANIAVKLNLITADDIPQYTVIELIYLIMNHLNEVTKIVNAHTDEFNKIYGEDLYKELATILREMKDDGALAEIINQEVLGELTSKVDNLFTGVNPAERNPYRFARRTKGTFNEATVVTINNDNAPAEVNGFREPKQLATYADRDAVGVYLQYQMPSRSLLRAVGFTANTVTVSQDILATVGEIEVGDILDVMKTGTFEVGFYQNDKYSGFVTDVDYTNKIIHVSGWYKQGNTSPGQIPPINDEYINVIVNPITKGWCINANFMLSENAHGWGGVIGEYGLFNSKSKLDSNYKLGGHDVVNFGGRAEFGYLVRGAKSYPDNLPTTDAGYKAQDVTINTGFLADGTRNGFVATNNAECAFKTANNKFFINSDGTHRTLPLAYKVHSDASVPVKLSEAPLHIFTQAGTYNLSLASESMYELVRVYSLCDDNTVKINITTTSQYGQTSQIQLTKCKALELFSDGTMWYCLNY